MSLRGPALVERQIAEAPARQGAYERGELRHSLLNEEYWQAIARASYYAWAVRRGFAAAGNDPLTGRPLAVVDGARGGAAGPRRPGSVLVRPGGLDAAGLRGRSAWALTTRVCLL